VLVGDHEANGGDQPGRLALVASPFPVPTKQSFLDIVASEAELPRLVERVECQTTEIGSVGIAPEATKDLKSPVAFFPLAFRTQP
jgi:hypothetical protein